MQCACAVLYYLWPVRVYHIFPCYFIKGTIKKTRTEAKMYVLIFPTKFHDTFLILTITEPDVIIYVHTSVCSVPVISVIY